MDGEREMNNLLDRENFRSEAPDSLKADIMRSVRAEKPAREFRLPVFHLAAAAAVFLVCAFVLYPRLVGNPATPVNGSGAEMVRENNTPQDNPVVEAGGETLNIDELKDKVSEKFNWLVYEGGGKETLKQEKERLVRFSGKMTTGITTAVAEVGSTTRTLAGKLPAPVSTTGE